MLKKGVKKVIIIILIVLLCAAMLSSGVLFFYYPHYKANEKTLSVPDNHNESITLISANVRTFSPTDLFKKSWFYRADLLVGSLVENTPDIIGFQEVTPMHYRYLCKTLSGYDNVIAYRDKSILPEACPIFYRESKFNLLDKGSFWLSETPNTMSKDWGSMCYRICSYVILENKSNAARLVVFNTHLDHKSQTARIKGIELVLKKNKQFGSLPSVIMGDLNATQDSDTYRAATALFNDAKYQTQDTEIGATFQDFGKALHSENIDYFLISKTGVTVNTYRILNKTPGGVYTSDHFPIYLNIDL